MTHQPQGQALPEAITGRQQWRAAAGWAASIPGSQPQGRLGPVSGFKGGRYEITWSQAGRWQGPGNCCVPRDPQFLERVFELHLKPAGFERHPHTSSAVLCVTGPEIAQRRSDDMFEAIRNPRIPRVTRPQ